MPTVHLKDTGNWPSFKECAEATHSAILASGWVNRFDFLASPIHCRAVKTIIVCESQRESNPQDLHILQNVVTWGEDGFLFWIDQIVATETDTLSGLVGFLYAVRLASSCSSLMLCDATLSSPGDLSYLCSTIASTPSLHTLHLEGIKSSFNAQDLKLRIKDALLQSSSLRSLSLDAHLCSTEYLFSLHGTPLTTLQITGNMARSDSSLIKDLGTKLLNNTSLTSLFLHELYLAKKDFCDLFTALERNSSLTCLSLRGCFGKHWSSSAILDCLQVNVSLKELDLTETPLKESAAVVRSALQRNIDDGGRMKYINRSLKQPTGIRLFLCSLPFSVCGHMIPSRASTEEAPHFWQPLSASNRT